MRNIKIEWFYNEESPKVIKCPTLDLLKNKEDIICYLLALNLYPKFQPKLTHYSYILENGTTGYLTICGNNFDTFGHFQIKFVM